MKKIYSSLAALALSVFMGGTAFAQTADVDKTALVGIDAAAWHAGGLAGTWAAPAVTTADGRSAQMAETYNGGTADETGINMWQEVTGLENGDYAVTLCANALYTPDRGVATSNVLPNEGAMDVAYVFANDAKAWVLALNAATTGKNGEYTLETTVTDGTLKIGLAKEKGGTNWNTIQIKSLTWHAPIAIVLAQDLAVLSNKIEEAKAVIAPTESLIKAIADAEAAEINATTIEEVKDAIAALSTAIALDKNTKIIAALAPGSEVEGVIVNPGFDNNNTDGWDCNLVTQANGLLKDGLYAEKWSGAASNVVGSYIKQTIVLPAAQYELSATACCRHLNAEFYAGETVSKVANLEEATPISVEFTLTEPTAIEIGYKATDVCAEGDGWFAIDTVKLTYKSGEVSTGISTVNATIAKNGKFINNGNIVILKNGKKYNVAGQAIK